MYFSVGSIVVQVSTSAFTCDFIYAFNTHKSNSQLPFLAKHKLPPLVSPCNVSIHFRMTRWHLAQGNKRRTANAMSESEQSRLRSTNVIQESEQRGNCAQRGSARLSQRVEVLTMETPPFHIHLLLPLVVCSCVTGGVRV